MRLVSEQVVEGRAGPVAPPIYPTLDGVDLTDIFRFREGQPWGEFARMRAEAPVMWHPEPRSAEGFWALTRYDDVKRVNSDPVTFSSERGGILMTLPPPSRRTDALFTASMNAMINLDGSAHRQLRKEHMPYFTAGYVKQLRDRVAGEVARRLDAMAEAGRADFVASFATHLPIFTLCEMLGIPEADRDRFVGWVHFLELAQQVALEQQVSAEDGAPLPPQLQAFVATFWAAMDEMFAYGRDLLLQRRAEPRDDLLSAIARAQIDGELLAPEYLDGSWLLIVFAGNDTTRNSLSGAVRLFSEHPAQRALLLDRPELLPNAVHEVTRLVSPVIYMRRTATADVEVNGQQISEGEKVVMYYGAANRDAAVFDEPDRFDITRPNAERNVAFGFGPHICIGRLAAQLQLEESLRELFRRFPDLRWTGEIDIAPNNFVHAVRSFGVEFTPRRRAA